MYKELREINCRPEPFQFYSAEELWTNEHTARQMLKYHLDKSIDAASRNHDFINKSSKWIISHFRQNEELKIADFGCGPGLYASRLSELGAVVTGIDFSQNSLDYARNQAAEKGLEIDYHHTDYLKFETTDKFDLIIMIMCDFCVLSPEQRKTLLQKFHSMLKPSGSVLLDVYSLKAFYKISETASYEKNQLNGFWSPDDYYCFVNKFKYEEEKVVLDKYTIIEEQKQRIVYNWFQHYNSESLTMVFEANGFEISELYSDVAGKSFDPESDEFAAVARKRRKL